MSDPTPSSSSAPVIVSVAPSKLGRTPGKAHKSEKTALKRSYLSAEIKTPFEKRMENEKKKEAAKAVERELKEEAETERQRKVTIIKDRRERQAERIRMEEMKAKMSAKKLQRMKKRQGRSKKISG
ncbi:rRNA-processing protein CGR1 [Kwoniella shandongensis]|uniref:rRNA-processing protein n=1 Tax=Kwoniella shandongensis TaxID=1734106 RepID=A0A5M6BT85_9TREE|nr:rRNA-processing protein CGR1 [Kwoniella shandongensis]KAA5526076.1 rRNA-processing protein CGR1 [Kwoniella shandongensis]